MRNGTFHWDGLTDRGSFSKIKTLVEVTWELQFPKPTSDDESLRRKLEHWGILLAAKNWARYVMELKGWDYSRSFLHSVVCKKKKINKIIIIIIIIIIITIVRERETKKRLSGMEKLFWPNAKRVADCTYVGYLESGPCYHAVNLRLLRSFGLRKLKQLKLLIWYASRENASFLRSRLLWGVFEGISSFHAAYLKVNKPHVQLCGWY